MINVNLLNGTINTNNFKHDLQTLNEWQIMLVNML